MALCTIVEKRGSGPAERGRKMLITEDEKIFGAFCPSAAGTIGGGELERKLKEEALKAIREGKSKSVKFSLYGGAKKDERDTGLWCGGTMTVFIDVIEPKPKISPAKSKKFKAVKLEEK